MENGMTDIAVLDVLLHGTAIGTLTRLPGDRILFAFTESYINNPDRATLSLSFKDTLGSLITEIRPTQTRVPPFFSNLLPEGAMRDYLADRARVNQSREFFLLWVLGRDLPGAITIRPAENQAWPPTKDNKTQPSPKQNESNPPLRFSLAGVQLKLSAVMEATGGLTIPVEGVGGFWIVKLPSLRFEQVPENEFAMMTLARLIGIDVPPIKLVDVKEISGLPQDMERIRGTALAVKRFDRDTQGTAIHMEDFAQVFGVYPERKYARASYRNIAEVIWAEIGDDGIAEFVRRLVFSVLIGNADMHLKNWSLIYPDQQRAALSPAYDFVSTIVYLNDENMALTFLTSKQMSALSQDTLRRFAAKARLPEKRVLSESRETIERFMEVWTLEHAHLPLSAYMIETINAHLRKITLVREWVKI